MSRSRATRSRSVLLALILLAAAACTGPPEGTTTGSPSLLPSERSASPSPSTGKTPASGPTHAGTAQPTITAKPTEPRYADTAGVGAMAIAYLRRAPARSLLVEIDHVEGQQPTEDALSHVEQVLERETDKPGGVTIRVDDQISEARDSYSFEQIEALERRYRDNDSGGARAVLYVLYLNGDLADEDGTLGVAYRASGVALFQERIRTAATSLVRPGSIERAVLTHEVGHVMGLVNIGYTSRHDHEDPDHPKHSRFKDSVMYWAIEDVSVVSLLAGGPPSDFDRFDKADLAARRA